jgi:hypothetical protein
MVNVKDWPLGASSSVQDTVGTNTRRNRVRRSQDYSSVFASGAFNQEKSVNLETQLLAPPAKLMGCLKAS